MAIIEAIKKRYSCRNYLEKLIEQEKLDEIFEAARLAPSAKNLQDWRFVVVTDTQVKNKIASATNQPEVFGKAGAIIAACSICDEAMRCGQHIGPIDVAIALEHIALQATQLGLASCWIGSFEPEVAREALGIPQDVMIVELMAVGYPADEQKNPEKVAVEKIISYNKWGFDK